MLNLDHPGARRAVCARQKGLSTEAQGTPRGGRNVDTPKRRNVEMKGRDWRATYKAAIVSGGGRVEGSAMGDEG